MENFSKPLVSIILTAALIFTIVTLYIFWKTGLEPTTLIISVFALLTGELWNLARIKQAKIAKGYEDEQDKDFKEF